MKRFFITGIGTDVGKTITAAIVAEALEADYWKPVQAGGLEHSDSRRVKALISNDRTVVHKNAYTLKSPLSPHAAAVIDGLEIDLRRISEPDTGNHLVIEGAGGLLVPLNDVNCVIDLIRPHYEVIVVSRHYLGSINHTLLTLAILQQRGLKAALIFSGDENRATERIIILKSGTPVIGRIAEEAVFDKAVIRRYAEAFLPALLAL